MSRYWLACAAVGAALIHLALVIGSPTASAAVSGVIGIAEFGWGLAVVAAARTPAPRASMVLALVPALLWIGAIFVSTSARLPQLETSLRVLPLLVATLLEFFIASAIAISVRRGARHPDAASTTIRHMLGIAAGVVVIAALTAPALAATQVGDLSLPAGSFDLHNGH